MWIIDEIKPQPFEVNVVPTASSWIIVQGFNCSRNLIFCLHFCSLGHLQPPGLTAFIHLLLLFLLCSTHLWMCQFLSGLWLQMQLPFLPACKYWGFAFSWGRAELLVEHEKAGLELLPQFLDIVQCPNTQTLPFGLNASLANACKG